MVSNIEYFWQNLDESFLRELSSFSRLIVLTNVEQVYPIELLTSQFEQRWLDDVRAVMDAVGSEKGHCLGLGWRT
jgi:hypothetical protein